MTARASKGILKTLDASAASFESAFAKLCDRRGDAGDEAEKVARKIVDKVRAEGDDAVAAFTKKFDKASVEVSEVTRDEWDAACEAMDPADRAALGKAAMRVREFHRKRIPSSWEMREEGGAYMGQRVRPLHRVGVYVPGGKAAYPSTVIMNAVPASVVEVPEIIMVTPPQPDGTISNAVLMAARVAGVHRVFKMGGAQAVAALAFGTETVPQVDKIVGPGNAYVQAAKRLVFGEVDIDSEAGATEVLVVADRTATPAWLAADLISQAEHEEGASAILVTHVKTIATRVQDQIEKQLKTLDRAKIAKASLAANGAVVLTKNLDQSIDVANQYAPEHMVLAIDGPDAALKRVENAGTVFLGHYAPVAVGDYLAGPNHVLPTGGTARFFSPLGIEAFLKRTAFVRFEPPKLRELGADLIRLAELEGFTGHGASVELRLQKIRKARREREAAREAEIEI
jgi:histidinol dehydrogenase